MCTVSFVRSQNKIILTSNRDEEVVRPSLEPKCYAVGNKNVYFPKDPRAGGTWFAVAENANAIVLLNGASERHEWKPPYRKSRGLIVLDLVSADSPIAEWDGIDLDHIEPFTIVLYEKEKLYQLRWNGTEKESKPLDPAKNYIWSSTTLYPKNIRDNRAQWFEQFLDTRPDVNEAEMFNFHRYTEEGNNESGLVIDRSFLKTLSITQTVIEDNKVSFLHHDLLGQQEFAHSFLIL
ncbi:NRDE family protein [Flavobacterium sp.]|uniref:NRDE family protein n=1 Tax=Flavobacterium sp. TaxID=239 RepID=UPI0039E23D6B